MKNADKAFTWKFSFGLEREDGEQVSRESADQLLDAIIEWVEARGMLLGGGYCVDELDAREEKKSVKECNHRS